MLASPNPCSRIAGEAEVEQRYFVTPVDGAFRSSARTVSPATIAALVSKAIACPIRHPVVEEVHPCRAGHGRLGEHLEDVSQLVPERTHRLRVGAPVVQGDAQDPTSDRQLGPRNSDTLESHAGIDRAGHRPHRRWRRSPRSSVGRSPNAGRFRAINAARPGSAARTRSEAWVSVAAARTITIANPAITVRAAFAIGPSTL